MKLSGPWSNDEVAAFLADAVIPLRLAVSSRSGAPLVLSLWFVAVDGALWCATRRDADVVRLLERDARCGFEIAADRPPYRGVRGRGSAKIVPEDGAAVLGRLLRRYGVRPESRLARALTRDPAGEVALRIVPERITSWDFTARMADAFDPTD
jgi:nitroimidazol reductase NimA-like FMN-containing flavoprotein (pyridoxamine 5'-phosphate oxidase superfamily)